MQKQLVLEPLTTQYPSCEHGVIGVAIGELDALLHVYELVQSKETIVFPTGITVLLSDIRQPQLASVVVVYQGSCIPTCLVYNYRPNPKQSRLLNIIKIFWTLIINEY